MQNKLSELEMQIEEVKDLLSFDWDLTLAVETVALSCGSSYDCLMLECLYLGIGS